MMKTIVYGTGALGRTYVERLPDKSSCIFADSNPALWGKTVLGIDVIGPQSIPKIEYDKIVIATGQGYEIVTEKLTKILDIPNEKIDASFVLPFYQQTFETRNRFLKQFAATVYERKLNGNIAEGGVFEGYFAKRMNAAFPDRTLYLFDTFQGFDSRDIKAESGFTADRTGDFNVGITMDILLSRMPNPSKIVIRKGYFPETAQGLDDKFVFVNLDFDLYNPTLAGLKFFYPKMVSGGVILVHDYFSPDEWVKKGLAFENVRPAVDMFCRDNNLQSIPIGDVMSVLLVKP